MICPRLAELPSPPAGKTGWPWTEESDRLTDIAAKGPPWPRISVITPSFNQGQFVEETIRSILLQGYPDLEYFVLDGGSTDGSVEIIKKYSAWLTYWVSEPDGGQSNAINRGLGMGSGIFATWINSDDMLYRNALVDKALKVSFDSHTVYVGDCAYIDKDGAVRSMHRSRIHTLEDLLRVPQVWRKGGNIVQPEVLFPRELALRVGGLTPDNHYSMDYELWGKFLLDGVKFQHTGIAFGMLRVHSEQKTSDGLKTTDSLLGSALKLLSQSQSLSLQTRASLQVELQAYLAEFGDQYWRQTGRLARVGLPRPIVTAIRNGIQKLERAFGVRERDRAKALISSH